MKIQIKISSFENKEIINVDNIDNADSFEYEDSYGANNKITIFDNGIDIIRISKSHNSKVVLRKDYESYIKIETLEGNVNFDAKVLAFEKNNDMISLDYKVNEETKSIEIKIVGDRK